MATDPEGAAAMSASDRERYMARVLAHGRERWKNFGRDFHEDDYLAGAMVAFEVFGNLGQLPANWVFGVMSGFSPILGKREEPCRAACQGRSCSEWGYVEGRSLIPDGWYGLLLDGRRDPLPFCTFGHLRTYVRNLDLD